MPEHADTPPATTRTAAQPELDGATAQALLQHDPCAIVLCDAHGRIEWCNRRLLEMAAGVPDAGHLSARLGLAERDAKQLHDALQRGHGAALPDMQIGGHWWRTQLSVLADGRRALHWQPADDLHQHRTEARRLADLLDLAQDFGRLGVWERDVRTMQGRWDRHTRRFWGLPVSAKTPDIDTAVQAVVAEDREGTSRAFLESARRAGTYAHRYRVLGADGVVRLLHSQWVVKDGADGVPERMLGILMDDSETWRLARAHAETAEQLQLALQLANIVVFRHDLQTDRVQVGEAAFALLGRQGRELSAEELRGLVHPDDRPALRASVEQALAGGQPVDVETRFRHADGSWRHVLTRRIVQRDAEGRPTALLGVGLDLSERIDGAKRQLELARQFELTTRAAGIGYWSAEADARRPRWSEHMFQLHGLPADAPAPPMAEWLQRFVHPDDRDVVGRSFAAWLAQGGPTLVQELRIVRADGATRHLLSYARLEGRRGQHDLYGVLMDVTERRAAQAALHQASERAALAIRGAGMGTWEQDLLTGQSQWDEQMWRLRGLEPRSQALDVDARMALVHPDDREATLRELTQATLEGRLSNLEFRVRWPDGQWRLIASRSIAVRDEQGQPTRRIGVNWDITDSRNAQIAREEKLLAQRESQAKSQFLSRMSHELRTPLNAVLGFAQLLLTDGEHVSADTRRRRLDQIQRAGRHLLSLIDDVLELSSLQGGEMRIAARPVPLSQLLTETLPLVERLARPRGIGLCSGTLAGVAHADPARLRQVLLTLLTDAVEHSREGGQVRVDAEAAGGQVLLRVSDTGGGMSDEQLQRAFEPFGRQGLESDGTGGTGIGLAIVKALVERMGGTVQARSAPAGTVFEVRLREATDSDEAAAAGSGRAAAMPSTAPRAGARARLLYIEDNPVNLLIVQELLAQRPDFELDTASDGASGVALACARRPDLVLVDMQLPDIDGHEVLRRLRADPATAGIRCISLSANAMPADIERALRAGFAEYWTKPLDLQRFMRSLDAIFA